MYASRARHEKATARLWNEERPLSGWVACLQPQEAAERPRPLDVGLCASQERPSPRGVRRHAAGQRVGNLRDAVVS